MNRLAPLPALSDYLRTSWYSAAQERLSLPVISEIHFEIHPMAIRS